MQVAILTAENAMLRDALMSSMHGDASSARLTSAATGTHNSHVGPDGMAAPAAIQLSGMSNSASGPLAPEHAEEAAPCSATDQMSSGGGIHLGSSPSALEPNTPPNTPPRTSGTLELHNHRASETDGAQAVSVPASRRMSKSVSFNDDVMFNTLKSVLQSHTGIQIPKHQGKQVQDASELQWLQGGGSQDSSVCETSGSESSEWSGDELLASLADIKTRRGSSSSSMRVQSLSGMLQEEDGAVWDSQDLDDGDLDAEDQGAGRRFSRSSISAVRRCATSIRGSAVTCERCCLCTLCCWYGLVQCYLRGCSTW